MSKFIGERTEPAITSNNLSPDASTSVSTITDGDRAISHTGKCTTVTTKFVPLISSPIHRDISGHPVNFHVGAIAYDLQKSTTERLTCCPQVLQLSSAANALVAAEKHKAAAQTANRIANFPIRSTVRSAVEIFIR